MPEDLSAFYRSLLSLSAEETHRQIIQKACEGTAVDAETLIRKLPPLPATFEPPHEVMTWAAGSLANADSMEPEELLVMKRTHEMFHDLMWELVKKKFPDLPEFKN